MGVAALVLGIIGTLLSLNWITVWVGVPMSIVALVLGILGRKQAVTDGKPSGTATAGMVLGIVGTAIGALIFAACASCMAGVSAIGKEAAKQAEKDKQARAVAAGPAATLGDTIPFADSTWVVAAARDRGAKLGGKGDGATTAGKFVEVRFSVTNLTKKEDSLLDLPVVVDAQGREYKPFERSSSFIPAGARDLVMAPLPPSLAKEFVEIYEVPADAGALKFKARALEAFGETKLVDLPLSK